MPSSRLWSVDNFSGFFPIWFEIFTICNVKNKDKEILILLDISL